MKVENQVRDEIKSRIVQYIRGKCKIPSEWKGASLYEGRSYARICATKRFEVSVNLLTKDRVALYVYSFEEHGAVDKLIRNELPEINRQGLLIKWNDKPITNTKSRHVIDLKRQMDWQHGLTDANHKTLAGDFDALITALRSIKAL